MQAIHSYVFSLTKDTLTIFNVALGNLETLKKSSDFRCPSSFPLYSPGNLCIINKYTTCINCYCKITLESFYKSYANYPFSRDLLSAKFNSIYVNNSQLHQELKEYLTRIAPKQEKIVKLHKKESQIFQEFNVTKQIKSAFGKNVTMKKGTYLVIEHTEALHVIDVNSGKKVDAKKDQEENALAVNLEAANEVARQLRLRDMGGIIVVDFIDMKHEKNRTLLTDVRVVFDGTRFYFFICNFNAINFSFMN